MPNLGESVVYFVIFLFATTFHEAAHAWAARRGGDLTAYHGGQVTLDPVPHIRRHPFGMVVLPIISLLTIGWPLGFASAPYDRGWAQLHPRRAAWMALAGPGANLLLILVAALAIRLGVWTGHFQVPDSVLFGHVAASTSQGVGDAVAFFLGALFSLNLVLLVLNLLPIPPLDGSGALPLLLPPDAVPRYQEFIWSRPALSWIGILVAWQLFRFVFDPVFLLAVNLLYPGAGYS
ncbi:MAG: hypothetical protein GF405_03110 [Candidatus Eisenbacteria bacterium]|nr:hypothetical protein [Candidatus Eisenbacteria bacterium]